MPSDIDQFARFIQLIGAMASDGSTPVPASPNNPLPVIGLARKGVIQGAGTYSSTEILGYAVLAAGTSDWTLDFVDSAAVAVPATSRIVGNVYGEHLSSITVGTGGSALLYLP